MKEVSFVVDSKAAIPICKAQLNGVDTTVLFATGCMKTIWLNSRDEFLRWFPNAELILEHNNWDGLFYSVVDGECYKVPVIDMGIKFCNILVYISPDSNNVDFIFGADMFSVLSGWDSNNLTNPRRFVLRSDNRTHDLSSIYRKNQV